MNPYEPLISPDDTQPQAHRTEDTQPVEALNLPKRPADRYRHLQLGIIILTSISLIATLALLFLQPGSAPQAEAPPTYQVLLIINGESTEVRTTAGTVGELLAERQILVNAEDALSDPPETPLRDGLTVMLSRARDVLLLIDGNTRTLRTPFTNPYDILRQNDIALSEVDRIWLDGSETEPGNLILWPVPVLEIAIRRAINVTIVDQGSQTSLITTADTVGEALFEAGITLYLTDLIEPELSAPLEDNLEIRIDRAQPLMIEVDGSTIETRAQGGTVADALAEAGIALVGLDYPVPGESAPLQPGMTIRIVRVTEEIISEEETLPYETIFQPDPERELDTEAVVQAGQSGLQRINTRVRYEDGVEFSREPAGTELLRAPANEIVVYGTQVVLRSIDTPEGPREYWRKLRVYATSYHPAALGGDNTTSIGETLTKGIIAADPGIIPYRTNLFVHGYGTGIMADTGGPRSSRYWIDLGYDDENWVSWSRYVDIYLLTPVPADINPRLPAFTPLRGR